VILLLCSEPRLLPHPLDLPPLPLSSPDEIADKRCSRAGIPLILRVRIPGGLRSIRIARLIRLSSRLENSRVFSVFSLAVVLYSKLRAKHCRINVRFIALFLKVLILVVHASAGQSFFLRSSHDHSGRRTRIYGVERVTKRLTPKTIVSTNRE
jgi:hypothetical protein